MTERRRPELLGTGKEWPLQRIMLASVILLIIVIVAGSWLVVRSIQQGQERNADNTEQTENASKRTEDLVAQVKKLAEGHLPTIQQTHEQQLAALYANHALLLYVLNDPHINDADLEKATSRLRGSHEKFAKSWPAAFPKKLLKSLTDAIDDIERLATAARRAENGERERLVGEAHDAAAGLDKAAATISKLFAGTSRQIVRGMNKAGDFARLANERTVENTQALGRILALSLRQTLWIMGIVIGLAMISQFLLFRVFRTRLRAGVHVIDQLARGDLSVKSRLRTKDEIGQLMASVEQMVAALTTKAELAEQISARDLSRAFTPSSDADVLGQALRGVVTNLNGDLGRVANTATQLAGEAERLSTASQRLSQGAEQQSATLEEIGALTELVSEQTRMNSQSAQEANALVASVRSRAADGDEKMRRTLDSMDAIHEASASISSIVSVIDEIAFQTNLLALNAKIEASQAGDAGKGFNVVASEVRSLAQRCALAAKNTHQQIRKSVSTVAQGMESANETAAALHEIVEDVSKASELMKAIAEASDNQAFGIEEINNGLLRANEVTRENTQVATQNASTSKELSAQTRGLEQIVSLFRLGASETAAA